MNKRRAAMLISMIVSFFLSSFLNRTVFIANTPRIRPGLNKYLAQAFFKKENKSLSYNPREQVDELYRRTENVPFNNVAKGTYVKSDYAVIITLYRLNEVDWAEYTYEINNKIYKFRVPRNVTPPAKKAFE
jgi:hypothetical protein